MQALRHVRCSQPVVVHEAHASVPRLLDGTAVQTIQSRADDDDDEFLCTLQCVSVATCAGTRLGPLNDSAAAVDRVNLEADDPIAGHAF